MKPQNGLKNMFQNVMISYNNKDVFNSSELHVTIIDFGFDVFIIVIDFGFVDKFKDENLWTKKRLMRISKVFKNLIFERSETIEMFQGNLMFASVDHMKFFRTSRS